MSQKSDFLKTKNSSFRLEAMTERPFYGKFKALRKLSKKVNKKIRKVVTKMKGEIKIKTKMKKTRMKIFNSFVFREKSKRPNMLLSSKNKPVILNKTMMKVISSWL
jgi:hypothetical protein